MQAGLFDQAPRSDCYEEHDLGDASIREYQRAFSFEEATYYLQKLRDNIPWRQAYLTIAGKSIAVPRLQCWMGDSDAVYGYSGLRLTPEPWHEAVESIRQRIRVLTGAEFNSVLLNYYRDGKDSVAWHADDESELGSNPIIASVSLGAVRDFELKHKLTKGAARYRLPLQNGSLLLMGNTLQNRWLHQIPKTNSESSPRINLTFRQILKN